MQLIIILERTNLSPATVNFVMRATVPVASNHISPTPPRRAHTRTRPQKTSPR